MRFTLTTLTMAAIVAAPTLSLAQTAPAPNPPAAAVTGTTPCRTLAYTVTPIDVTLIDVKVGITTAGTKLQCGDQTRHSDPDPLPWEFQGRQMQTYGGG